MIVIGLVMLILGYVLPIPALATIGWILLLIGLALFAIGATGHPVGGRRYWW